MKFKAIVIGTSMGGMRALQQLLSSIEKDFTAAIIIVQHIGASSDSYWIEALNTICKLEIKEAEEKEKVIQGCVYIAPPNYHLMIEKDETFSLSVDEKVNYARPSVDVLFESAASVYKEKLIGIILTGANNDGALGLWAVKKSGGLTIVQDPVTAEASAMPLAAIASTTADYILPLNNIAERIIKETNKY